MFKTILAWGVSVLLMLATIFINQTYGLIGVYLAGVLAVVGGVAGAAAPAFFAREDRAGMVVMVAFMVASLSFTCRHTWNSFFAEGSAPDTRPLVGDPSAFDAIGEFAGIRAFVSPEAELFSMEAFKVPSGPYDLFAADRPSVRYNFIAPPRFPEVEEPTTEAEKGLPSERRFYQVEVAAPHAFESFASGVEEVAEREGIPWPYNTAYRHPIWRREKTLPSDIPPFVPAPACSLAEMWKAALATGVSADGKATIIYNHEGYRFRIGKKVHLRFGHDCGLRGVVLLTYNTGGRREAVPELTIDGESAGAMPYVHRAGHTRELWLDPGRHVLVGRLAGERDRSVTVNVAAGEEKALTLRR